MVEPAGFGVMCLCCVGSILCVFCWCIEQVREQVHVGFSSFTACAWCIEKMKMPLMGSSSW